MADSFYIVYTDCEPKRTNKNHNTYLFSYYFCHLKCLDKNLHYPCHRKL